MMKMTKLCGILNKMKHEDCTHTHTHTHTHTKKKHNTHTCIHTHMGIVPSRHYKSQESDSVSRNDHKLDDKKAEEVYNCVPRKVH